MKKTLLSAAATAGLLAGPITVEAVPIDTSPITSDYYIEFGGLLWAWASPVNTETHPSGNILYVPEIQDGWRMATEVEWASRPLASDFGTVDHFKCASQFWNSYYAQCDYSDGLAGYVTNIRTVEYENVWDLWYVKDISVPEPNSLALLGIGLASLGLMRRRRVV